MATTELQMSSQLEQIHGEIRDNFRALSNGFQRLDKMKDSNRQSKQLEERTAKMRDCKRLIKDFDREIKDEESKNPPEVNKQLNDEKQSMIKELNSYVGLRKTYMNTLGNKKIELFDMGAGASEPTEVDNVKVASSTVIQMAENKAVIGLKWEPKLPALPFQSKTTSGSGSRSVSKSQNEPQGSSLWKPNQLVDGLFVLPNDPLKVNKLLRKQAKDTAGSAWFDMPAPTLTPKLKKDLQLLKLRGAIDPKRHYKMDSKSKALLKYFQVGTVVESVTDYYSGRMTKNERKSTLAEELLSDPAVKKYRKRKVREIEERNRPAGNEKWKIKGHQTFKRAKQRRH